ncbi:MAG: hypothetical protein HQ530_04155 [Parcubacteria group bacterium]|nr:hypothetical protein [Parcubacteria group bacterium]
MVADESGPSAKERGLSGKDTQVGEGNNVATGEDKPEPKSFQYEDRSDENPLSGTHSSKFTRDDAKEPSTGANVIIEKPLPDKYAKMHSSDVVKGVEQKRKADDEIAEIRRRLQQS